MDNESAPHFVTRSSGEMIIDGNYAQWLKEIKQSFRVSQSKAAITVNRAMLEFYWRLGRDIVEMQKNAKWGNNFIEQLSSDLRAEFPEQKGFSERNLKYIRQWYSFYSNAIISNLDLSAFDNDKVIEIRHQVGAQIGEVLFLIKNKKLELPETFSKVPWRHHVCIVSKTKTLHEAIYYISKTIEGNWSRSVLENQLSKDLYNAQGQAITNFDVQLPSDEVDEAKSLFKDPYHFDFLSMGSEYDEKNLEDALVHNITRFLLELGQGFSFVGRQKELRMPDGQSYYPDLIFYHIRQHRYVVVELKVVSFKPEFAGKLNFYVKAADELLRGEGDNKSVGLLICKDKDKTTVEWALSDISKPLGVASYELEEIVSRTIMEIEGKK